MIGYCIVDIEDLVKSFEYSLSRFDAFQLFCYIYSLKHIDWLVVQDKQHLHFLVGQSCVTRLEKNIPDAIHFLRCNQICVYGHMKNDSFKDFVLSISKKKLTTEIVVDS